MIVFKDKTLECCGCKKPFVFTAGEQEFYLAKAFVAPRRCPDCRKIHKKGIRKRRRDLVRTLRVEDHVKVEDVKGLAQEKKEQGKYHEEQEKKGEAPKQKKTVKKK